MGITENSLVTTIPTKVRKKLFEEMTVNEKGA